MKHRMKYYVLKTTRGMREPNKKDHDPEMIGVIALPDIEKFEFSLFPSIAVHYEMHDDWMGDYPSGMRVGDIPDDVLGTEDQKEHEAYYYEFMLKEITKAEYETHIELGTILHG